jgi:hypothetical protein
MEPILILSRHQVSIAVCFIEHTAMLFVTTP